MRISGHLAVLALMAAPTLAEGGGTPGLPGELHPNHEPAAPQTAGPRALTNIGGAGTAPARIKDITTVSGVRDNQLVGYGLVVGLPGTGDSLRNAPFTEQAITGMLDSMGLNVRDQGLRTRNVAGVMVTAELPPFARLGTRIDAAVASLGDATALRGGTLLLTQLMGADGHTYAVAQGAVSVSGFAAEGDAETLTQGVPTAGRVANGAMIEREIPGGMPDNAPIVLELRNPDFSTAVAVADRINAYTQKVYGIIVAQENDLAAVTVERPTGISAPRFLAEIGHLRVRPDAPARVLVDESTGTVVIGADVQISPVAVSHGNLTVRITETPQVSQPAPFSQGETVTVPRTEIEVEERDAFVATVGGADLQALVDGLNRIGLKPSGIIAILQSIKSAGALQAELIVQ